MKVIIFCNLLVILPVANAYLSGSREVSGVYDFIVVGGGTAGCAVASRLSENGKYTVLILEKGKEPDPRLYIPAISSKVGRADGYWKSVPSVPQKNVALESNGIVFLLHGETLGGNSAIGGMSFNRGSPNDYDLWAKITGDDSWNHNNLLQNYFRKIEDYKGDFPSDQHGFYGPMTVSRPKYAPGLDAWLQAGIELGYPVADPNGPQTVSVSPVEYTKRFGRRLTSYVGYIQSFGIRPNLKILTDAFVDKIIFNGNRAVGVRFNIVNSTITNVFVAARKEIIICAGVIGSPVLLMKSGIGPQDILDEANISPQITYLPVGRNLQDHIQLRICFALNDSSSVWIEERDLTPESLRIFNQFGEGPYTVQNGQIGQIYITSPQAASLPFPLQNWSDIHVLSFYTPFNVPPDNLALLRDGEVAMSTLVFNTRPKSTGLVTLNTTDVDATPLIDFQYLTHPDDMDVVVYGIKVTLQLFEETYSHQKLGARWLPSSVQACKDLEFRSDEYWVCYIKQKTSCGNSAVGTCRMGKGPQDPDAVVDSNLRVIGVERLRVADASVMPSVPNTNIMTSVFVIAEKVTDMILRQWDFKYRY